MALRIILAAAITGLALASASAQTTQFSDCDHPQLVKQGYGCVKAPGTIVDVALGNPNFSTLVSALGAANLVATLQGPGPFTVFAPTNGAFAKVPPAVLNLLLSDPAALASVLTYHVLAGAKDLRFRFLAKDFATVQGQEVYVERERDGLKVNNSVVSGAPIVTTNGVIYVIDSVLLPQYR